MIPEADRYDRRERVMACRIALVENDLFIVSKAADACYDMAGEVCVPGGGADHRRADQVMAMAIAVRNLALDAEAELREIRQMLEKRGGDESGTP